MWTTVRLRREVGCQKREGGEMVGACNVVGMSVNQGKYLRLLAQATYAREV